MSVIQNTCCSVVSKCVIKTCRGFLFSQQSERRSFFLLGVLLFWVLFLFSAFEFYDFRKGKRFYPLFFPFPKTLFQYVGHKFYIFFFTHTHTHTHFSPFFLQMFFLNPFIPKIIFSHFEELKVTLVLRSCPMIGFFLP